MLIKGLVELVELEQGKDINSTVDYMYMCTLDNEFTCFRLFMFHYVLKVNHIHMTSE